MPTYRSNYKKWDYKAFPQTLRDADLVLRLLDDHPAVGQMGGRVHAAEHTRGTRIVKVDPDTPGGLNLRFIGQGVQFIHVEPAEGWSIETMKPALIGMVQRGSLDIGTFEVDRRAVSQRLPMSDNARTELQWLASLMSVLGVKHGLSLSRKFYDLLESILDDDRSRAFQLAREIGPEVERLYREHREHAEGFVEADDARKRHEQGFAHAEALLETDVLPLNGRAHLVRDLIAAFKGGNTEHVETQLRALATVLNEAETE